MAHDHHHHDHAIAASTADRRWLRVALGIVLAFMAVEIVAGVLADSLALLSDAAHMLTDAGAIGLALVAARLAARPPKGRFTFGLGRAEILSAQVNGALLLLLAGVIAWEAGKRIYEPPDVEGAFVLTDLYASIAAALSGGLILLTGVRELDGVAALIVAALMVSSGWRLLRDASAVLLEGAPQGIDPDRIGRTLAAQAGVVEVHDLHVWEVTSGFPAIAAHVVVPPDDDCHQRRRELQRVLAEEFGVEHTTLQVDHATKRDQLLTIER